MKNKIQRIVALSLVQCFFILSFPNASVGNPGMSSTQTQTNLTQVRPVESKEAPGVRRPSSAMRVSASKYSPSIIKTSARLLRGSHKPEVEPEQWDIGLDEAIAKLVAAGHNAVSRAWPYIGVAKGLEGLKLKAVKVALDEDMSEAHAETLNTGAPLVYYVTQEGLGDGASIASEELRGNSSPGQAAPYGIDFDAVCGTTETVIIFGPTGAFTVATSGIDMRRLPDKSVMGMGFFVRDKDGEEDGKNPERNVDPAHEDESRRIRLGENNLRDGESVEDQMMHNFQAVANAEDIPLEELRVALWGKMKGYTKLLGMMREAGIQVMDVPGAAESHATRAMLDRENPNAPHVVIGHGLPEIQSACVLCKLLGGKGWFTPVAKEGIDEGEDLTGVFDMSPEHLAELQAYELKDGAVYGHEFPLPKEHNVISVESSVTGMKGIATAMPGIEELPPVTVQNDEVTVHHIVTDPSGAQWHVITSGKLSAKDKLAKIGIVDQVLEQLGEEITKVKDAGGEIDEDLQLSFDTAQATMRATVTQLYQTENMEPFRTAPSAVRMAVARHMYEEAARSL